MAILDLVPGHSSVGCTWFRESMKAEPNEYSHRYIWTNRVWQDIKNVAGITGLLRGISERDGCCGVNYYSCQSALNYGFAEITAPWQHPVDSEEVFISEWGDPERFLRGGFDMDFLLHFGPSHYNDLYHCKTPCFPRKVMAVPRNSFPTTYRRWKKPKLVAD